MQIQINTDHNIVNTEAWAADVSTVVEHALSRFTQQITRVEVHVTDENSSKGGADDKRCVMEGRLEGRPPMAVTHDAATVDDAVKGASQKLARSIESTLGRLHDHTSRRV